MATLQTAGARIAYQKAGAGPPILFIQGAGVVGEGWRPQIEGLSDRHTTFAFDNRGMGASALEPGGAVTIDDMARDALAIMDAERVGTFHVVGHSMGGLIAQAIALRARERVRSLSLLCSFVAGSQGARMTPAMLLTAVRMRVGTRQMRRNAFLDLVMPPSHLRTCDRTRLAQEVAPLFGYDLARQPWFVMRQVQAMARYDRAGHWAELATVPTLIVSGTHDRISRPEYGRALATLIPGARFVELPDAGHGLTIQCREEVNALLQQHISAAEALPTSHRVV